MWGFTDRNTGMADRREQGWATGPDYFSGQASYSGKGVNLQGLGLSLGYDIVMKGHGGTLEVASEEGAGSEFVIILPIKTL